MRIRLMCSIAFLLVLTGCGQGLFRNTNAGEENERHALSTIPHDTDLAGRWYWIEAQMPDGEPFSVERMERGWPYIEFMLEPEPNGAYGLYFDGYNGCNTIFGAYLATPDKALHIRAIGQTQQGCTGQALQSEDILGTSLTGISPYEIQDNTLVVRHYARESARTERVTTLIFHRTAPEP